MVRPSDHERTTEDELILGYRGLSAHARYCTDCSRPARPGGLQCHRCYAVRYRKTEAGKQATNDSVIRYNKRHPDKHKLWRATSDERKLSVLSDKDIERLIKGGRLKVDPYEPDHLQPSSIDITLDSTFLVRNNLQILEVDPRSPEPDLMSSVTLPEGKYAALEPGGFVLGSTREWVELDDKIVARIEGRSSLGRLGLVIHSTAGYVDPGWKGTLTLEIGNIGPFMLQLWPGMKIGQISFLNLSSPARRPYGSEGLGSKYQGQRGPVASRGK